MKLFISISVLFLALITMSTACKTNKTTQKTVEATGTQAGDDTTKRVVSAVVARDDIRRNDVKYYSFGIVAPSKAFISTMQTKYHITVLSQGCVVGDGLMDYNGVVDSFMKAKYGKSISDINMESRNH